MTRCSALWLVATAIACGNVEPGELGVAGDPELDAGVAQDAAIKGSDGSSALCVANQPLRCEGDTLVACNASGSGEVQTACSLRCNPTSLACEAFAPSNNLAAQLADAELTPALAIASTSSVVFFDTVNDFSPGSGTALIAGHTVKAALVAGPSGSPDVLVLSVGSFTLDAGVTLSVQGRRALAVVSPGNVAVNGILTMFAGHSEDNELCAGGSSSQTGADKDIPGGGGGGFGEPGARGGDITGVVSGRGGGSATGSATLVPLRGGCIGGFDGLGAAGSGGGALQISTRGSITVTGAIAANGLGGVVSSGGGSGGGILLEARTVAITGGVFANGGAGGCGGFSSGANANLSTVPAAGAVCTGTNSAPAGGNGGARDVPPTVGGNTANHAGTTDRGGGGGGGVGRVRINTLSGAAVTGTFSPAPSLGLLGVL